MDSLSKKLGRFLAFAALWGALVYANLRSSPEVPWALPALVVGLAALWRYLGGAGWPARTRARRRELLRANPVPLRAFLWSGIAGLFAVGALAGLWIVTARLWPMPPNRLLPGRFTTSPAMTAAIVLGASLLAPVIEESAVRGYLQSALERDFHAVPAVSLSSLVFAAAHVSQGLALPKLGIYFLVGVTFGALAYWNDSILPAMPVHMVADLVFFLGVWPHDANRIPVARSGFDGPFWWRVAQIVVCGVLALVAFGRLRAVSPRRTATAQLPRPAARRKVETANRS
jgi:membrane protease YdiL (CAAX protease family)